VRGLAGVREVAVGGAHTCARDDGNRVWCWGDHLANGLAGRQMAAQAIREPVRVQGLPPVRRP